MALELVTGFAGKAHITSKQTALFNAALAGTGDYLLGTQSKLSAKMTTANKMTIQPGDVLMQGHHITSDSAATVTIESGASGYKRNDLVCIKYTKNASTGVESVAWVVKKGTATTGTAADPSYTKGDILNGGAATNEMPVYRVSLNGITPSAPVLLLEEFQSLDELRDSISPVNLNLSSNLEITVYPLLGLGVCALLPTTYTSGWHEISTLPAGYRPKQIYRAAAASSYNEVGRFSINPDGTINISASASRDGWSAVAVWRF